MAARKRASACNGIISLCCRTKQRKMFSPALRPILTLSISEKSVLDFFHSDRRSRMKEPILSKTHREISIGQIGRAGYPAERLCKKRSRYQGGGDAVLPARRTVLHARILKPPGFDHRPSRWRARWDLHRVPCLPFVILMPRQFSVSAAVCVERCAVSARNRKHAVEYLLDLRHREPKLTAQSLRSFPAFPGQKDSLILLVINRN